ncbi:hypothetical protein GIB67_023880 [Kingdonia uniflora]|uniref:Uncharacterized protein n=1 Tax=Kingdonia uniflora TaxID=39325 RepID=A0A7J7NGN4_9MAGN|nr:hypothetical protein GIB67_023880 [Kingdonia uniflora]
MFSFVLQFCAICTQLPREDKFGFSSCKLLVSHYLSTLAKLYISTLNHQYEHPIAKILLCNTITNKITR